MRHKQSSHETQTPAHNSGRHVVAVPKYQMCCLLRQYFLDANTFWVISMLMSNSQMLSS